MSEPSDAQTQPELEKLRQLVEDLGALADSQRQLSGDAGPQADRETRRNLLRLLALARATLETLARRFETQEKERRQLRALQDMGAVINSSLNQTDVLNAVMDTIIRLTGAERSFLMLSSEETGELEVEVARNINRETIEQSGFEISRSIVGQVADTGVAVVTTNAQADPRFSSHESIISYNLRSILCVPLKIKDNAIGVIYADNRVASGVFSDTDRDLLAAFANQAAVAIENARLFQQIRDQLADITEMKNLQDDVFDSIASGVITIDVADRISLYNRAAERILGVPSRHVLEKEYRVALAPIAQAVDEAVNQTRHSGGHSSVEVDTQIRERAGPTTVNLTVSPLRDLHQSASGVALVLNDISETKRLESVRRYLPSALVDRVRDIDAAQRPQRRSMSVLFADVRGFSTFSEQMQPESLIEVINGYFTVASRAINEHEGLIDKFMGDSVMALFNTPLNPQEDHAVRAVRTALMVRDGLTEYHQEMPEQHRLYFRFGIHTGEAVAGNLGGQLRKDYSAIGDAVNLAKRLQEIASPNQILLSHDAFEQVKGWVQVKELEPVHVKGRRALERIYSLTGLIREF